jgi:hypothetical protein
MLHIKFLLLITLLHRTFIIEQNNTMGRPKANSSRINVMLSQETLSIAKASHGGLSKAVNLGLELLCEYACSVYRITHRFEKRCFIGIFLDQNVTDVHYHFVHDLGANRLGSHIRRNGLSSYDFEVIAKTKNIRDAVFIRNIYRRAFSKKGYDQSIIGLDEAEAILLHDRPLDS